MVHLAFWIETDCGTPSPPKMHMSMMTVKYTTTYQSNVTYQCDPGYWFQPDVLTQNSTCQLDGNWSELNDCIQCS